MEEKPTTSQTVAQEKCSKCSNPINLNYYFCPNCGKKLKEPPFRFSWSNIGINILISILLPPLGIIPGFKHLRLHDQKALILGVIYIVVTFIATAAMLFIIYDYVNNMNKMLNEVYQIQRYY